MANSKITVAENFANVKAFLMENDAPAELVNFITDRMEKASHRSPSAHKLTDEQVAVRNEIYKVLESALAPMSISEMQKASELLRSLTTAKISGNITPNLTNGKNPNPEGYIVRSMVGKTAKFALV